MRNLDCGIYDLEIIDALERASIVYNSLKLGGSEVDAYQHIIVVLDMFFQKKFSATELEDIIFDCSKDGQIDALYVNKNNIYIFDVKRSDKFDSKDVKYFVDSVKKNIFEGDINKYDIHPKLIKKIKEIKKIKNPNISLILFRNCQTYKSTKNFPELKKYTSFNNVQFFAIKELLKKASEDKVKFPDFSIKAHSIEDNKPHKEEVLLKIRISDLLKHKEFGELKGGDFFYKNVRNPNYDSGFKKELINTLRQYKDKFHLLHNGITILSDDITYHGGLYTFKNPQIVNGAQTIGLLNQIKKEEKINFNDVYLYCKILTADSDLSKKVCETANTQQAVNVWELRAHDELHIKLESYLNNKKSIFNYERKKTNKQSGKKIKLDIFIQLVYAACFMKPWLVKTGKKSLFKNPTDNTSIYFSIDKYLQTCDVKYIDMLCNSLFYVDGFIKDSHSSKKGFLRDVRFYLIAFVFQKNNFKKKDLKSVVSFLLKLSNELRNKSKGKNLTNNKIFNQNGDLVWNKLVKKYAIK